MLAAAKINTVLAAIYWSQVEPQEGKFDFSIPDGLVREARSHNLRLVLLWFATWKNGLSGYPPDWVKRDFQRFPRAQIVGGTWPCSDSGSRASRSQGVGASNCSAPSAMRRGTPMLAPLRP